MVVKNWAKLSMDSSEYINRNGDILKIFLNGSSSYVQLIGGRQRRFIYQATPTKKVSQSGAMTFARSYMRSH